MVLKDRYRKTELVALLLDSFCVAFAYVTSMLLRFKSIKVAADNPLYSIVGVFLLLFCIIYSVITGWNRKIHQRSYLEEGLAVTIYDMSMMITLVMILFVTGRGEEFSRIVFVVFALMNLSYTYLLHTLYKTICHKIGGNTQLSERLMIITELAFAERFVRNIRAYQRWKGTISAIAIMDQDKTGEMIGGVPIVCNKENLFEFIEKKVVDSVFMYLPNGIAEEVEGIALEIELKGVMVYLSLDMVQSNHKRKEDGFFAGFPVVTFWGNENALAKRRERNHKPY